LIINGGSRGGAQDLAKHLLRTDTNELVEVIEIHHGSQNLAEALADFEMMVNLTKQGQLGLYHANIDPDGKYEMTSEQWQRCVELLEQELGFEGLPRAVVRHKKEGREHLHVVWQRTDTDTQTLRTDSWNYKKHELASRQLEKEFGHELVQGKHVGEKELRSKVYENVDKTFTFEEFQREQKQGRSPEYLKELKEQITQLYQSSDGGRAFQQALADDGFILAQGKKRAFIFVDRAGLDYSVSRYVVRTLTKEIKAKFEDLNIELLPTSEQAKEQQKALWEENKRQQVNEENQPARPEEKPEIRITEQQIKDSQALQEIDERFAQDLHGLIEYQKDEQLYQEGIWKEEIEQKTKIFEQQLEERQKREYWADWGLDADSLPRRQDDLLNNAMKNVYFRKHQFWAKWDDVRKGDVTSEIKKYHEMRQKRLSPQRTIQKAEDRKKIYAMRNERDAEELTAFVDDLHRDRDDKRLDFEREQARERLNLEHHKQEEMLQELKREQEREKRMKQFLEDQERDKDRQRGRGYDPNDRER